MGGLDDHLLPPEIWREILARLPVKSVLRCRSVCKSWYSLVSCPDFISHHSLTNLHKDNGNRVLLQLTDAETHAMSYISHDMDMESGEKRNDYHPDRLIGYNKTMLIGSCNGLILLSDFDWNYNFSIVTYLIWNSAIRKTVELPSFRYCDRKQRLSYVGFGFDPNTSDYKVMFNLYGDPIVSKGIGRIEKHVCQILDLSKGVWRSISSLVPSWVPPSISGNPEAECYVNGAIHWSRVWDRVLLSFNMSDERFREIRMPDCAEFDDNCIETLCVTFGGLLHMIVWTMDYDSNVVDTSESCSIWAMKEYGVTESWIKVSNIDLRSAQVLPSIEIHPHRFILWAKGEILMSHRHSVPKGNKVDLVLYNIESKKSKHLLSTTNKFVGMRCLYKESPALM